MKKPMPFGKYYLLDRVNVGGMAEVFKAKTEGVEGFERLVAVKRILPSIAEDEEFIKMFIDEAKIAVQLTHQNIAQIIDLGKVGDAYFIAMEYIHGRDLRATFDRSKKKGEILPLPMSCFTMMKLCEGLDYAHNKKDASGASLNLVHRDVSPQNILISFDGEVKIIDFGIAKAANKAAKTQAGILKGKFGYMSPEQVRGLPLDKRSDIFSCGIILYELVTGERLFIGESDFSTLEKVRNVEIMPPTTYNRAIPEELERIVLKTLAKEKEDRYQTAMDLHDDLQSFMYTIESFFSQKDLAAYLRKAFPEDVQVAGAPAAAAPELAGARASKLPPPRRTAPPPLKAGGRGSLPPPPRASAPPPSKRTMMGMPAAQMPGPSAPPPVPGPSMPPQMSAPPGPTSGPTMPLPAAPPMPLPPAPGVRMPSVEPTMPLSAPMLAAAMPPAPMPQMSAPPAAPPPIIMPGLPPPPAPPAPVAPPAPAPEAPAAAPSAPPAKGEGMMEWDDEEMATQIYDKADMIEATKGLSIDTSGLSRTGAPVPAKPAPAAPAPAPSHYPEARRSKAPIVAVAILLAAVVVTVLIIVFGGKKETPSGGPTGSPEAGLIAVGPEGDAGSGVPGPALEAGTSVPVPVADGGAVTPATDAGATAPAGKAVNVILASELQAATISINGTATPWQRSLSVPVPEGGTSTLKIDWPGKQCKETLAGKCPEWTLDPSMTFLEIAATDFVAAPIRLALQGTLREGAALFEKVTPAGSTTSTYEGVAITTEGQSSFVALLPGTHTLVVRREGFPDFELPAITVPENAAEAQPVAIPLLVALEVTSKPESCRVLLAQGSGEPQEIGETGTDPVRRLVDSSQSYRIRVTRSGYRTFEEALTFQPGQTTLAMAPELEREEGHHPPPPPPGEMGKLSVVTQPWTMVYIQGRRVRQTPLLNYELAAGRYQLTLLNQDVGIRHTEMVIIQAGRTTMIRRTQDQLR
ncbi:MAG: protein kinase [Deltaproteobacteria bacterium]|nr:protein kinase [Deltaproteobacteria bacterium]